MQIDPLSLVIAITSLFVDRRKIQQEGLGTIWYQHPKIRNHLKWIGRSLFLLLFLGAFTFCLTAHVPLWLLVISEAGICLIGVSSGLIFDLIKMQRSHQRGEMFVWYQQPHMLRRMGKSTRFIGLILLFGAGAYEQVQGFPDSYFPWNMIFGIGGPAILLLVSLMLSHYADALQKTHQIEA